MVLLKLWMVKHRQVGHIATSEVTIENTGLNCHTRQRHFFGCPWYWSFSIPPMPVIVPSWETPHQKPSQKPSTADFQMAAHFAARIG